MKKKDYTEIYETVPTPTIVRYGFRGKKKKNTLFGYVVEDLGVVFFGIARCRLRNDMFVKKTGRLIARERAKKLIHLARTTDMPLNQDFFISEGFKNGYCKLENLQKMKDFFDHIDRASSKLTAIKHAIMNNDSKE